MKAEVLAPDKGSGKRDFHFEAEVKRVHIYPTGYPQFNKAFLTIVENPVGTITIHRHGEFCDDVKAVYKLTEDGESSIVTGEMPK